MNPRWRDAGRQALAFAVLGGLLFLMFHATSENLRSRGIHSGFGFLWEPTRTPVADSPLPVQAGVDPYAKVFVAGALNSLKITLTAIAAATLVGVLVGLGRLSSNALARVLARWYVEAMRNVPLLLHIFLWYGIILQLPGAADAHAWGGQLLATNRGIFLFDPVVDGFEVHAGLFVSPEFLALFIGITVYTAAFIAEIVRAAVGSLPRGQWEAASALGLSRGATLRRVVLPQALRVALPPLTGEYLGIFKNSTLAVAVGYQDFMAVSNTMLTDTGQAVEVMAVVMGFYAVVSLMVSAGMHGWEHRNARWGMR